MAKKGAPEAAPEPPKQVPPWSDDYPPSLEHGYFTDLKDALDKKDTKRVWLNIDGILSFTATGAKWLVPFLVAYILGFPKG